MTCSAAQIRVLRNKRGRLRVVWTNPRYKNPQFLNLIILAAKSGDIPECIHRYPFNQVLQTFIDLNCNQFMKQFLEQTYALERQLDPTIYCKSLSLIVNKYGARSTITKIFLDHLSHIVGIKTNFIFRFVQHEHYIDHELLLQSIKHEEKLHMEFWQDRKEVYCCKCSKSCYGQGLVHGEFNLPNTTKCCRSLLCKRCTNVLSYPISEVTRCPGCEMILELELNTNLERSSVYACCRRNERRHQLNISLED